MVALAGGNPLRVPKNLHIPFLPRHTREWVFFHNPARQRQPEGEMVAARRWGLEFLLRGPRPCRCTALYLVDEFSTTSPNTGGTPVPPSRYRRGSACRSGKLKIFRPPRANPRHPALESRSEFRHTKSAPPRTLAGWMGNNCGGKPVDVFDGKRDACPTWGGRASGEGVAPHRGGFHASAAASIVRSNPRHLIFPSPIANL